MTTLQQCNLTEIEVARFNQIQNNPDRYPSSMTVKDLKMNITKILKLVEFGYLKKSGWGFVDGSIVSVDFYKVA